MRQVTSVTGSHKRIVLAQEADAEWPLHKNADAETQSISHDDLAAYCGGKFVAESHSRVV